MSRILCSTGALIGRPNGRNFRLLSECIGRLACDGFEFMLYDSWYDRLEELEEYFRSLPVRFPCFHVEKRVGELISHGGEEELTQAFSLFEINCSFASKLSSELLVLHLWSGLDSDKNIEHNIGAFGRLKEIAERYDLLLTVENVVCNHADPMTHMKRLVEVYPDISFTYDTKMAEFHRQLYDITLPESAHLLPHIKHMHINDYKGGIKDWSSLRTLPVGEGQIDFARWFHTVREIRYNGDFTVEATVFDASGEIHCDMLTRCFRRIKEYI